MHDSPSMTPNRYVPFKAGGWGIAAFIILLAIACWTTAWYIHERTYLPPSDVRSHAVGDARESQR